MLVHVKSIRIPPMSTLGYGKGVSEDGTEVEFVGDHSPMRVIGEALEAGAEDVWTDVPAYAIVAVAPRQAPNLFSLN